MKQSQLILEDYRRLIATRLAAQEVCDRLQVQVAKATAAFDSAYATEQTVRNALLSACFTEAQK
jgi:hypothetical protein